MLKIKEAIVVEGRYDKNTLSQIVDAPNGKEGEWNSSESGHPHIFTADDGRTFLFFQGNNDKGKTWYISNHEVLWRKGKPQLKPAF